jgi:hypothetical protein
MFSPDSKYYTKKGSIDSSGPLLEQRGSHRKVSKASLLEEHTHAASVGLAAALRRSVPLRSGRE